MLLKMFELVKKYSTQVKNMKWPRKHTTTVVILIPKKTNAIGYIQFRIMPNQH